jgi:hypothetical protein
MLGVAALASAVAVSSGALDGGAPEQGGAAEGDAAAARRSESANASAQAEAGDALASDPIADSRNARADDPIVPTSPSPLPIPAFDPSSVPRWIAAASGPVPELNQVSLEQDMALAAEVLGPGGRVLFGAGPGTSTVQVLAEPREVDRVVAALGDLFSPRGGRDVRYRETRHPSTGRWFVMITESNGAMTAYGGVTWASGFQVTVTDIDADGRADLLLYNPADGRWFQCITIAPGEFRFNSGNFGTGWTTVVASRTILP